MRSTTIKTLLIFPLATFAPAVFGGGDQDPCFLLNWDVVTGGSAIESRTLGECEYEVEIDGATGEASVQHQIPPAFLASEEHWIRFLFTGRQFDNSGEGHFRIMSLQTAENDGPLLTVDLFWNQRFSDEGNLFLEAVFHRGHPLYPGFTRPVSLNRLPINISEGLESRILVELKLTESSGPSVSDGGIELWVEGELVASKWGELLDWSHFRSPISVRFGVLEIFDPESAGILRIAPIQPTPYRPEF